MRIIRDDLWLCYDCHFAASGVDETIVDQGQAKATEDGLIALGPDLVPDYNSETGEGCEGFARYRCDCCGIALPGSRHRYAVLGPDDKHESHADTMTAWCTPAGQLPLDVAARRTPK